MTDVVYIASPESGNGRNVVASGIVSVLAARCRMSIFRPVSSGESGESFTRALLEVSHSQQDPHTVFGVDQQSAREHQSDARADIVASYYRSVDSTNSDIMVVVGTDASAIYTPERFTFDARVAADLQAPVLLAIGAEGRNVDELKASIESCTRVVEHAGSHVVAVFVTGCTDRQLSTAQQALTDMLIPHWAVPAVEFSDDADAVAVQQAADVFASQVVGDDVVAAIHTPFATAVTPYSFQHSLLGRAKTNKKTIVLPEGGEARILQAADYLLARDVANLIVIGEHDDILQHAHQLGLDHLELAQFQSLQDRTLSDELVGELVALRANKGMTAERAREQLQDATYFGTMLVHTGRADGLVSGAVESTANTVRPALQVIKTKPDTHLVSSSFLMCFNHRVVLFADCAINLNPSAQDLAQIALQTAATARTFGIEPRIGMLSYSTLGSGKGSDVDLVRAATTLVNDLAPDLPVVGPIQFDAAWSATVAQIKAPGNTVAGHVNVFIFPNLSAGNIGYKAVQRTSGAVAIGPVLQGLRKPVNDLSRGALVRDIVNTVALTAIEAGNRER